MVSGAIIRDGDGDGIVVIDDETFATSDDNDNKNDDDDDDDGNVFADVDVLAESIVGCRDGNGTTTRYSLMTKEEGGTVEHSVMGTADSILATIESACKNGGRRTSWGRRSSRVGIDDGAGEGAAEGRGPREGLLSRTTTTTTTTTTRHRPPKAPSCRDGDDCNRRARLWYRRSVQPFWKVTAAQILCAAYILILTFSKPPVGMRDPITNDIIDTNSVENTNMGVIYVKGSYRPVVAVGNWQKTCLAISRASAFSMYPVLVVVFVTKMKATQCFLSRTPLSMYLTIANQAHEHHAHAGAYLAFDVWVHTLFHVLRWSSQGNSSLLWTSAAGLSGLIAVIATPLIAFPMMYYRNSLSYEVRKG
jgi:hypothetical protein